MDPNTLGAKRRWDLDFARSVRIRQEQIRSAGIPPGAVARYPLDCEVLVFGGNGFGRIA